MDFFQCIQQAVRLAEEQGFSLKFTLDPIIAKTTNGNGDIHPVLKSVFDSPLEKGDLSIVVSPLIDTALDILGVAKVDSSISPDIVFEIFELIRTETELLLPDYEKLKAQFGGRLLHTGIARIIAEKLALRNKGKRVIVEKKDALIGSYTQIYR